MPRPYDALLAEERQAGCLLAIGREADGRDLLTRVLGGLTGLGATAAADRVAGRLRDLGVDPAREWRGRRGYGTDLSPSEVKVVRLVVTGKTNREIGEALSRSPRTVSNQLYSVMRKLKVKSRTEVVVRALEMGIVGDGVSGRIPGRVRVLSHLTQDNGGGVVKDSAVPTTAPREGSADDPPARRAR